MNENYNDNYQTSQDSMADFGHTKAKLPLPPAWLDDEQAYESAVRQAPQAPQAESIDDDFLSNFIIDTPAKQVLPEEPTRQYITTHTPHDWLDEYIQYSRQLSPRGFNALHEVAGLWAMSATIAGRVVIYFGGKLRHTSLMFTAVARSSVWVKSHTIGIAEKVLVDAGQSFRLLPTKASPQAIIEEMSNNQRALQIIREMEEASGEPLTKLASELSYLKEELGRLFANEGQRAWYISEFGSKIIAGMMRAGSVLADFSDFLRDINEKVGREYVYRTRGHGRETISNPYLAIIADTTPADIRPYTAAGAPLWSNGFFPRFALIAPTSDETPSKARVAYEHCQESAAPHSLTSVIAKIDERLDYRKNYHSPLQKFKMVYSAEIWNAIYEYETWIDKNRLETEDLDGTYARLVFEQSVAIATLLATFDGHHEIQTRHYQRAKEICERIRRCTEDFYIRMTQTAMDQKEAKKSQTEDRIISIITKIYQKKEEWPTLGHIRDKTGNSKNRRLSNEDILNTLDVLKDADLVEEFREQGKRSMRYRLVV